MVSNSRSFRALPGLIAPAVAVLLALSPAATLAQAAAPPPASAQPVPGELDLSKLIWTTLAAVDHANQSGNYSVLRDLSAPSFQAANDAARLTQIFAGLRSSGTDLSNALLLGPTWTAAPAIVPGGLLRLQGFFGLRPTAIAFDLSYQWVGGRWRLYGVGISPRPIAAVQPEAPAPRRR
ncbi:hypothetical protein FHS79_000078 [Polymorphobacter multimanifer]|uniref:Nuclear transport factor 2 family protein n=1 Tax=Polymorphobacter multimanifer TaxID=1070431 RepID=A0A841KZT3_9SPHN|nr:hypothetical protein [Polymorphobacter multimanifer]MBB6225927.1 hypothetical protein [Polymorphobacter multimanifer]